MDAVDPSAVRAPMDWATQFLGAPPEGRLVIRQPGDNGFAKDLTDDAVFSAGPLRWAATHCAQTDVYAAAHENLIVMHGVPAGLDPNKAAPGESPRPPSFKLLGSAPSGALAFEHVMERRKLFILPNGTWVLGQQFTGERLAIALAAKAEEPPFLPLLPNAVVQVSVDVKPGFIQDAASRVPGSKVLRFLQGLDKIRMLGFAIYPSPPKRTIAALVLLYDGSSAARDAAEDTKRLIASGALKRQLNTDDIVGADTDGPVLFVRIENKPL